jgi:hypothetical protein
LSAGLLDLAARCEAAGKPSKALNREIALAVGWVRQTPSEARRSNPAWFHPDDCRDGHVLMDSLHGTTMWREPLDYTASLDAAMTLVPDGWHFSLHANGGDLSRAAVYGFAPKPDDWCYGATPAVALCAAALRARAQVQP